MNPEYPIFVVSKGRWLNPLTARSLDKMGVPYRVVVEPQEFDDYASTIELQKILTLPFSNLGQGSIPARNWIWDQAMSWGATSHWILDDNIEAFNRLNRNVKPVVESGSIFRAAEDFVGRYENVALAGFNYYSFCKATEPVPPYYLNTRIYSCILIRNDIPFRWRGRYNEGYAPFPPAMAKQIRISFRTTQEFKERVQAAAKRVGLDETVIEAEAIKAVVAHIERHGQITIPVRLEGFPAKKISRPAATAPARVTGLNEPEGEYPKKGKRQ